jgi:hypothetical protein
VGITLDAQGPGLDSAQGFGGVMIDQGAQIFAPNERGGDRLGGDLLPKRPEWRVQFLAEPIVDDGVSANQRREAAGLDAQLPLDGTDFVLIHRSPP